MIKKLLLITFMLSVIAGNAQSFSLMYPFSSVVTSSVVNTGTLDPTPTPTAAALKVGIMGSGPAGAAENPIYLPNRMKVGRVSGLIIALTTRVALLAKSIKAITSAGWMPFKSTASPTPFRDGPL